MTTLNEKKRGFHFPSSVLMLFIIIVIVTVLTYIIPAGQYDYVTDEVTGRNIVQSDSFHFVEQSPVGPFKMFTCIADAFAQVTTLMACILFGYFWVYAIMRTGAFAAMINSLLGSKLKDSKFLIPLVFLVFALAGSTYGEFETVYGLIPIFIALAYALGYDAIVGLCMCCMSVGIGFACATTNPFTVGLAQTFAELPMFSGLAFRWIIFIVFYVVSVSLVMLYANKVKKNPEKSIVRDIDFSAFRVETDENMKFTTTHKIIMLGMVVSIVVIVYGSLKLGWYMNEMVAVFLISGIISSLIAKRKPEEIAGDLVACLSDMMMAVIVITFARTILVVMQQGVIIDTIIYGMNTVVTSMPAWATGVAMLVVQNIINFFIPSGTGQAAAIMPIMVPLADLTNVSRQAAVLAYQFGDGFSNLLWPTGGIAVMCGIGKIPLGKWYKFFLPVFGVIFALQVIFMVIAVAINYS